MGFRMRENGLLVGEFFLITCWRRLFSPAVADVPICVKSNNCEIPRKKLGKDS